MALLVLLLATLALGLAWSLAGPFSFWLFSGVSWHIYVGAALLPILIWHSLYHTRGFPIRFWADRRSFLRLAGLVAIGFAGWQVRRAGGEDRESERGAPPVHRVVRGDGAALPAASRWSPG